MDNLERDFRQAFELESISQQVISIDARISTLMTERARLTDKRRGLEKDLQMTTRTPE